MDKNVHSVQSHWTEKIIVPKRDLYCKFNWKWYYRSRTNVTISNIHTEKNNSLNHRKMKEPPVVFVSLDKWRLWYRKKTPIIDKHITLYPSTVRRQSIVVFRISTVVHQPDVLPINLCARSKAVLRLLSPLPRMLQWNIFTNFSPSGSINTQLTISVLMLLACGRQLLNQGETF